MVDMATLSVYSINSPEGVAYRVYRHRPTPLKWPSGKELKEALRYVISVGSKPTHTAS